MATQVAVDQTQLEIRIMPPGCCRGSGFAGPPAAACGLDIPFGRHEFVGAS